MEIFNVSWNRHDNNKKYIVGFLIYAETWFFKYNKECINEAIDQGFRLFMEFSKIDKLYEDKKLFVTFSNRINLSKESDSIEIIKKSNGKLVTDNILILTKRQ